MNFEEKYPHLTPERISQLWEEHESKYVPESGERCWWVGRQTVARKRVTKGLSPVKRAGVRTGRKSKAK